MARSGAGWPFLLLGISLLAGCSDANGSDGTSVELAGGGSVQLENLENQAGKGSISGVVVDEAIRPLGGVNLTLGGRAVSTLTDDGGLFVFRDLEPGLYTIIAGSYASPGKNFLATQTTAEVLAGETAKVRIVLPTDPAPVGYHGTTMKFDGFYEVGSGFVDEVLDLYVFNQTYGTPAGNVTTPPGPNCICRFSFDAETNVSTFVVELVWEESNPAPEFWTFDLNSEYENGDLFFCEQGSPCLAHISGGNYTPESRRFSIGVWTDPSWVYVNQPFQLFVTLFYVTPAPSGWSFVAGDT